jgi:hypothetical protein
MMIRRAAFGPRWITAFICIVAATATPAKADPPSSVCRDDFCFSVVEKTDDTRLTLRGVSTFRYWGLRVYTAALYVPASATLQGTANEEIPKKLILRYHRSLSIDQFVENSEETLEKDPQLSLEALRPSLSRMNSLYVPVQEGDTYSISYNPKQATMSLFFNDRLLGQITDRQFARAYFGIWLSEHSVSKDFTNELLGKQG